jgi:hypothetical protein
VCSSDLSICTGILTWRRWSAGPPASLGRLGREECMGFAQTLKIICITVAFAFSVSSPLPGWNKVTAPEIITRHLASIGSPEGRTAWKSSRATGNGRLVTLSGPNLRDRPMEGPAEFLSQGRSYYSSLEFGLPAYPAERYSFDGKQTHVGMLNPGERSVLGEILFHSTRLLAEGLIGGSLSTAWPLLDLEGHRARLRYLGIRNGGSKPLHEVVYEKQGGLDYEVRLYFDPDTFRHVATAYSQTSMFRPFLEETFGDFRTVDGVTIPFSWKMRYSNMSSTLKRDARTIVMPDGSERIVGYTTTVVPGDHEIWEWEYSFRNVQINAPLDPGLFVVK